MKARPSAELKGIDPKHIEQKLDERLIGERIRALRVLCGLNLSELGRQTGLSAGYLSQIETGRVVPTLRNLARLALVFQKDMSCFFAPEDTAHFRKLREDERIPLTRELKNNAQFVSVSLSALVLDRTMVPCLANFHPNGGSSDFTPKIFPGVEFFYLIEGSLEIVVAGQRHLLEAGDVCWIDGATNRQYCCTGQQIARAAIITKHAS